ncbi:MAG: GNAT family N-acetyltransferase, partial [bacterium]|nr:GNAT family N-acetyltransferase [bacterium]
FIRKNLMCCDQLRLPEQKAYFPRIKIELLTIAIPRIKILDLLQLNTYWQNHLTLEALTMLIANSQCFLATQGETIIGFARVLSDGDNFASLWDVVVDKKYQGQGIGKNMIHHIFIHTLYNNIKKWLLFTDTAHKLYRRFGFAMVSESANHMITMI